MMMDGGGGVLHVSHQKGKMNHDRAFSSSNLQLNRPDLPCYPRQFLRFSLSSKFSKLIINYYRIKWEYCTVMTYHDKTVRRLD